MPIMQLRTDIFLSGEIETEKSSGTFVAEPCGGTLYEEDRFRFRKGGIMKVEITAGKPAAYRELWPGQYDIFLISNMSMAFPVRFF